MDDAPHANWFEDPCLRLAVLTGFDAGAPHPREISEAGAGGKFAPDGTVLGFPGNTFICHIDPTSDAHAALTRLSAALQNGPTGGYFAYLPPSSFHMTVFPAICGNPLGHDGWPADLPTESALSTITETYRSRLADVHGFKSCTVKPIGTLIGTSVILEGASAQDTTRLLDARRALQDLTRLFRRDFGAYRFHVSVCYQTRWMDPATAKIHLAWALPLFDQFRQDVAAIKLGPIEFCKFSDMTRFDCVETIRPDEQVP